MDKSRLDLAPEEVDRIINFLGYGCPSAPVWFIGFEEGLGDMKSDDDTKNRKARGAFENVMDLHEAHLHLQQGGQRIDLEIKPPRTQVWRFMAKIMLARDGYKDWHDRTAARDYVRFRLGRKNGDTFLTELSPIPAGSATETKWMTEFAKLDDKLNEKISKRKENLKCLLKAHSPNNLAICYGAKRAGEFAKLLDIEWKPVCEKIWKSDDSKCLLLPFFGNGQMSHSVIKNLISYKLLSN